MSDLISREAAKQYLREAAARFDRDQKPDSDIAEAHKRGVLLAMDLAADLLDRVKVSEVAA